jgi:hypothetical protein
MPKLNAICIAGLETIKSSSGKIIHAATFMNNMETWKKDHTADYNTTILDARKFKEMADPLGSMWAELKVSPSIDVLFFSSHSDPEGLYLISRYRQELEDNQRFVSFDTVWDGINFSPTAKIYLGGCQAGGKDGKKFDVCIAQDIANKTGVSVFAYVWKSSQQYKNGRYFQVPDKGGFVEFT